MDEYISDTHAFLLLTHEEVHKIEVWQYEHNDFTHYPYFTIYVCLTSFFEIYLYFETDFSREHEVVLIKPFDINFEKFKSDYKYRSSTDYIPFGNQFYKNISNFIIDELEFFSNKYKLYPQCYKFRVDQNYLKESRENLVKLLLSHIPYESFHGKK